MLINIINESLYILTINNWYLNCWTVSIVLKAVRPAKFKYDNIN